MKVSRVVERERQFVRHAPGVYRHGFNTAYSIADATVYDAFQDSGNDHVAG